MSNATRSALALCLWLASACGQGSPPAPSSPGPPAARGSAAASDVPADVVLWVDEVPIRRAELEPLAVSIGLLYPAFVERHCLRLALTNVALPRAAASARWPQERAAALAAADACARDLERGAAPATAPETLVGHWKSLGLETWGRLRTAQAGVWSAPFEDVGRFLLVRLVSVEGAGPRPGAETYTLEILSFAYLPASGATSALDDALDAGRLRIQDPAFGELVPEAWKHRMQGARE